MNEITACPHPFKTDRVQTFVPDGLTIAQILEAVQPRAELRTHAHVFIGDRLIESAQWETARPVAGQKLTIRMVPSGGGGKKNPLATILSVVVMAGALWATGGGAASLLGSSFASGTMGAGALAAGIGIAGSLAINAIAPPPKPRLAQLGGTDGKESPTYNVSGGRNRMAPYAPMPRVYGRHLVVPPYAAPPYSELVGQDQYMRFIFMLGYGPLLIEDPKIGETSVWDYEGTQLEIRQGFSDDLPLSLFPNSVTEEGLGLTLTKNGGTGDGWETRTTAAVVDEFGVEITFPQGLVRFDESGNKQPASVQVAVQYRQLPSGAWNNLAPIVAFGSPQTIGLPSPPFGHYVFVGPSAEDYELAGGRYDLVTIERVTGSLNIVQGVEGTPSTAITIPATPWGHYAVCAVFRAPQITDVSESALSDVRDPVLTASGAGNFLASLSTPRIISVATGDFPSGYLTVVASKSAALRFGVSTKAPYPGQYEVRLRRETEDSTDEKVFDTVVWTLLRSISHRQAIEVSRLPNMALAALRVKATDELSGMIDQFSCMATSILPYWNGTTWSEQPTSNPAAIYRDILQGSANPRPVADARVDLPTLKEWSQDCTANNWQFNGVIDFRSTVFQLTNDVASTGRATFGMRDGLYSVVRDKIQTTPIQHFTPRNSWGFRGEKSFVNLPHALRVRFINAEAGYKQDERIVYADGYDALSATKFETMDYFGITSPSQAWSQGRYYIACATLRPETYSINVDVEHLVCTRGDMVAVSHDVTLHGIGAGRIKSLTADGGGNITALTLDEYMVMEEGKTYSLRIRRQDGSSIVAPVATVGGETNSFTLSPALAPADSPATDDLASFGETGLETVDMIVTRIEMMDDLAARLILIDAAPAVHSADIDIPDYDPQITQPTDITKLAPGIPVILSIFSDERALIVGPDGSLISRIVVTALPTGGNTRTDKLEAQYRRGSEPWQRLIVSGGETVITDVVDGVAYDIRVRAVSSYGVSSAWNTTVHTVIGKTSVPPDVTSFLVRRDADGTRVFTWETVNAPLDVAGVQIRYKSGAGQVWADMAPIHSGVQKSSPYETNQLSAGEYTFAIKNIDTTGHESTNAKYVELTIGDPRLAGAIDVIDDYADGWTGTKTGCYVDPITGYLLPLDNSDWTEIPATWADWTSWNDDPVSPIVYERQYDVGTIASFAPIVTHICSGTPTITESHSNDGSSWSSYAAAGLQITARYIRIKISVVGAYPVIQGLVTILSATPIEETVEDLDTSTLTGSYRIGTGDIRLPITKTYAVIKKASIVLQNVGAGWSWTLIDKDVTVGPRVKIYNASGVLADAVIDADIRGV